MSTKTLTYAVGVLDGTCQLDACRDADLAEDVAQVRLDRLLAEEQLGGDLGIGFAVDDEPRDLELACGQRFEPVASVLPGARAPVDAVAELPSSRSASSR